MTTMLTDTTGDGTRSGTVAYDVTLRDGTVERVDGADAYEPERSMTTFFRTDGRPTVDCWSIRMASFRTDEILAIRRLERAVDAAEPALRVV
jgi:hypothetical protein